MQFEVGDTVALTGATLLDISLAHPAVFEKLRAGKRTGGKITSISATDRDDRKCIEVDMGPAFAHPIAFEINTNNPQLTLQLIKKVGSADLIGVQAPEGSAAFQVQTVAPDGTLMPPSQSGFIPPPIVNAIKEMALRDANAVGQNFVPQQIHMAQWVMIQFIGLKQYVIVQDLNRDAEAEDDGPPPVSGDEWKDGGNVDGSRVKRIQLTLAEGEERLYCAAMTRIRNWIEQVDAPPESPPVPVPVPVPSVAVPDVPVIASNEQAIADDEIAEEGPGDVEVPAADTTE